MSALILTFDSGSQKCLTYLTLHRACVTGFLSGAPQKRCEVGGWAAYGVFPCPGEVHARQQLSYRECCRYREGLQLLLWVTFISAISMHATHRHSTLEWMNSLEEWAQRRRARGATQLASEKTISFWTSTKRGYIFFLFPLELSGPVSHWGASILTLCCIRPLNTPKAAKFQLWIVFSVLCCRNMTFHNKHIAKGAPINAGTRKKLTAPGPTCLLYQRCNKVRPSISRPKCQQSARPEM